MTQGGKRGGKRTSRRLTSQPLAEKKSRVGLIEKLYGKPKGWLKRNGGITVKGFESVPFKIVGPEHILAEISGKAVKVAIPLCDLESMRVFRSTDNSGRLLFLQKGKKQSVWYSDRAYEVSFVCYSKLPEPNHDYSSTPLHDLFLKANVGIYPSRGAGRGVVAFFNNFKWYDQVPRPLEQQPASGDTRPPAYLKGKGFGLLVNSLLRLECYRAGVKKAFAQIDNRPESLRLAELNGFRVPTEEELELAESAQVCMQNLKDGEMRPFSRQKRQEFEGSSCALMAMDLPGRPGQK
ncbi:MAG: hypothetical protein NT067_00355 [Candidatus Diapherotrites archaeon]|nr:hypothetical protein [Candidatus Diapherotrites archaeon]